MVLPSASASGDAESTDVLQGAEIARTRDYLNTLVEESVADGDQQVRLQPYLLVPRCFEHKLFESVVSCTLISDSPLAMHR